MVSRIFYYSERLFVIHTEYPPFACFRCPSERCCDETLVGSVEFRCFKEVVSSWGKMVFDGSIKRINCITEHKDYDAITNRAVLVQVALLLQGKWGKTYRRHGGVSENELVHFRTRKCTIVIYLFITIHGIYKRKVKSHWSYSKMYTKMIPLCFASPHDTYNVDP